MRFTLAMLLVVALTATANAQAVSATFTTTPAGGNYAPKNIVAVWVEDSGGAFQKTIGRWAVERCDLTIEAAEPPDTEDWTDEDIARACDLDRTTLETAQEEFRAGPGQGRYAEHPHLLEVTIRSYAYTQWHRAIVDDEADPPTLRVEPIPGGFCDT